MRIRIAKKVMSQKTRKHRLSEYVHKLEEKRKSYNINKKLPVQGREVDIWIAKCMGISFSDYVRLVI
jgi:hypothetical protein